jgi:hypothetical protein
MITSSRFLDYYQVDNYNVTSLLIVEDNKTRTIINLGIP